MTWQGANGSTLWFCWHATSILGTKPCFFILQLLTEDLLGTKNCARLDRTILVSGLVSTYHELLEEEEEVFYPKMT